MEEKYIKELQKLIKKSINKNETPVAALIVKNNKIISKSYNKRNIKNNVLMHAEIESIIKAAKKLKTWRLNKTEMYVTLEPCEMCKKVIEQSRIEKVYYYLSNSKTINYKTKYEQKETEYSKEYQKIISSFFKKKR